MLAQHQKLIKSIIDLNPQSINMYWGYKGDYITKVCTTSLDTAILIEKEAHSLGLEVVTKYNPHTTKIYDVHCIAKDEDVYGLK